MSISPTWNIKSRKLSSFDLWYRVPGSQDLFRKKLKKRKENAPGQKSTLPSAPCCNGKVFCRENGKLKYPRSPGNAPLLSTPDYVGVLELGWKGECKRRGLDKFRFSDPGEASLQVGLWAAATRVSDSQCNLARLGCHVVFISC